MLASERKALLRLSVRSRWRPEGPHGEQALRSLLAQQLFLSAYPPAPFRKVALYAAIRGEVGTDRIRDGYLEAGATLYYPRADADGTLSFFPHPRGGEWELGRFGIREPRVDPGAEGVKDGFDLVLVPGVAFDPAGRRLGKGYGYFDRFLAGLGDDTETVGLAFSWQLVPEVPVEEWDVPVDTVVTDEGILRARRMTRPART
ncbi:MAG: 5-formyltetrahydrofolate cyclo-ligase [Deltaproteobacteria bacterium]